MRPVRIIISAADNPISAPPIAAEMGVKFAMKLVPIQFRSHFGYDHGFPPM
jgi:hypothetical protein